MLTLSAIPSTKLFQADHGFTGKFSAMGSPCEVLMETNDLRLASRLFEMAVNEAQRIEKKWSRYLTDNIIHQINNSQGQAVSVDKETARLIDFAAEGFRLSEGLFDITSGVLRRVWQFNGKSFVPKPDDIKALLNLVGWGKVHWDGQHIQMKAGMEIDLGGLAKEYAVDRVATVMQEATEGSVLVNFGGDIAISRVRLGGLPWMVGIEKVEQENQAVEIFPMREGAVATSGDSKRFVLVNGKRYGHIINPQTGWPVEDSPRSVTVVASTCTQAGFLTTLAMLNGSKAQSMLTSLGVKFWCY